MKPCVELVVYRVHSDHLEKVSAARQSLMAALSKTGRLLEDRTHQNREDASLFVDYLVWASEEDALNAFEAYKHLEEAGPFQACIAEVISSGHYVRLD